MSKFYNAKQVMRYVDRATPDMSDNMRSEVSGKSQRCIYRYRRQRWMMQKTVEDLLDAFDLGYLLHTEDWETKDVSETNEQRCQRYQSMNISLRTQNADLRRKLENHRRKLERFRKNNPSLYSIYSQS